MVTVRANGRDAGVGWWRNHITIPIHQTIIPVNGTISQAVGRGRFHHSFLIILIGGILHFLDFIEVAWIDEVTFKVQHLVEMVKTAHKNATILMPYRYDVGAPGIVFGYLLYTYLIEAEMSY